MTTKILDAALTDLIDELHNLTALVGAAKQATYDFVSGEHDIALVDRVDRLMMLADDRIQAAMQRADSAQREANATA